MIDESNLDNPIAKVDQADPVFRGGVASATVSVSLRFASGDEAREESDLRQMISDRIRAFPQLEIGAIYVDRVEWDDA